jgi:hypothetical protein
MNTQEFNNSIKRSNLRIMGIEVGEQVQRKVICNIFSKIMTENFPNLEKTMPIQVQEASNTKQTTKTELPHDKLSLKHKAEYGERILKAVLEKTQITYKVRPIKILSGFSMETLKQEEPVVRSSRH